MGVQSLLHLFLCSVGLIACPDAAASDSVSNVEPNHDSGAARAAAFARDAKANGWVKSENVDTTETVHLTFWIKQQHTEQLKEILESVSDPDSPNYGHYLTKKQVDAILAPKDSDVAAVRGFLGHYGKNAALKGAVMEVDVPVHFAEELLGGRFVRFCRNDGECAVRNPSATLPAALKASCDIVTPIDDPLPPKHIIHPMPLKKAEPAGCCFSIGFGSMTRPCCLKANMVEGLSACDVKERIGGLTAYKNGTCPSSAAEAAAVARGETMAEAEGCCFSFGFGAKMRPCCLSTEKVSGLSACKLEQRMVGATSFLKGACPANAEEAFEAARHAHQSGHHAFATQLQSLPDMRRSHFGAGLPIGLAVLSLLLAALWMLRCDRRGRAAAYAHEAGMALL